VLEAEFVEDNVEVIPMTFPFPSSHFWWPNPTNDSLDFFFDFKSSRNMAVLASSEVNSTTGKGYWEVKDYIFYFNNTFITGPSFDNMIST
jgi:hypothetical protein